MADNKQLANGASVVITVGNFKGLRGVVKDYRKTDDSYEVVSASSDNQIPKLRWQRNELEPCLVIALA